MTETSADQLQLATGSLKLVIAPRLGGAVTRFCGFGSELFRRATPESIAKFDPLEFSCFPLVPFSNRIAFGRFDFDDRSFELRPNLPPHPHPLHGHGWRTAWRVVDHGTSFAELELVYSGSDWPSSYRAVERFELTPDALAIRLSLTNQGTRPMPAGIGLHPYFDRTPRTELSARVAGVWLAEDCLPREHTSVPEAWDFSSHRSVAELELDHCFSGWDGVARVDWPERGMSLRIEAPPPLDYLVVYVPRDRDFFCVEPVSHANDAVNLAPRGAEHTGFRVLMPGESLSGEARFIVERI